MKQQWVFCARHVQYEDELARRIAEGWTVVNIAANDHLVYFLCERDDPVEIER